MELFLTYQQLGAKRKLSHKLNLHTETLTIKFETWIFSAIPSLIIGRHNNPKHKTLLLIFGVY